MSGLGIDGPHDELFFRPREEDYLCRRSLQRCESIRNFAQAVLPSCFEVMGADADTDEGAAEIATCAFRIAEAMQARLEDMERRTGALEVRVGEP